LRVGRRLRVAAFLAGGLFAARFFADAITVGSIDFETFVAATTFATEMGGNKRMAPNGV